MANLTITAANVQPGADARKETGISGGTITQGMAVYKDATDSNKYKPARASTAAAAAAVGIALTASASGQPVVVQTEGVIDLGVSLEPGVVYGVAEETPAGSIAPISDLGSGDYVTVLGIAAAADELPLKINASGVALD